MTIKRTSKILSIGIIGNLLEWYDLTIYGFFSPIIAKLFFPNDNPLISLLAAFGVFAIGFLVRPLGAILFGYLGDRFGRKIALFISLILVAVPTFLIGLTPTYSQIGYFAPLLLIFFRLLQGLSAGGEYTSSILFLTEHANPNKKGFFGSFVYFGAGLGWLLGSFVSAMATVLFTEESLLNWAWRIPFLLGLFTGAFGLYIRKNSTETILFKKLKQTQDISENPIKEMVLTAKIPIFIAAGLSIFSTVGGYIVFAYMPLYLSQVLGMHLSEALTINTIALAFFTILVPFTGWLSDKIGRQSLFFTSCLGLAIFSYPLFNLLAQKDFLLSLLSMLVFAVFMACFQGPFPAMLHELFRTRIRASAMAISYNISAALFAGTVPLICTMAIQFTGDALAPAYYLIFAALISLTIVAFQTLPSFSARLKQA